MGVGNPSFTCRDITLVSLRPSATIPTSFRAACKTGYSNSSHKDLFSKYRHGAYGAWGTAQQSPTPGESPSMDFPDLSSALFLARC